MLTLLTMATLYLAACDGDATIEDASDHTHEHPRDDAHDHGHGHDHDHHHGHAHNGEDAPEFAGDAYPLDTCPISGEELGSMGSPASYVHEEREIKFCCPACDEDFEEDPDSYLAAIDEKIIEQQDELYPLDVCPISGEALNAADNPVDHVWNNRLVRFCCPMCIDDFEQDPQTHIETLNQAVIEQQTASYPLDLCVISDEPLDEWGTPFDIVIANRLVRACCDGCVDDLEAHPAKVFAALDRGEPLGDAGHSHDHHDHDHAHD